MAMREAGQHWRNSSRCSIQISASRIVVLLAAWWVLSTTTLMLLHKEQRGSSQLSRVLATSVNATRNSISNESIGKVTKKDQVLMDRGDEEPTSSLPYPYWNLSCPLEMSSFSAVHMGFTERAEQARQLALPAARELQDWINHNHVRRIFFVGDSLLRQVFMSLACHLLHSHPHDSRVSATWYAHRHARTHQPNSKANGIHSKFEEGHVWINMGDNSKIELIFHHSLGGLLSLAPEYEVHDHHVWLLSCFQKQPLEATVLAPNVTNETVVERYNVTLNEEDVVLLNGSVHGDRVGNLRNIADLLQCTENRDRKETFWPRMLYMTTSLEHFPTDTNVFEELLYKDTYECRNEAIRNDKQREERRLLGKKEGSSNETIVPFVGDELLELQKFSGVLHVGNRDCLHWIMPGLPDLLAASLVRYL